MQTSISCTIIVEWNANKRVSNLIIDAFDFYLLAFFASPFRQVSPPVFHFSSSFLQSLSTCHLPSPDDWSTFFLPFFSHLSFQLLSLSIICTYNKCSITSTSETPPFLCKEKGKYCLNPIFRILIKN